MFEEMGVFSYSMSNSEGAAPDGARSF
jgi:hypothetical protein